MNHADVRARMADYLEGHLGLTDRALLDAHLDGCPECSADIAEMRATIGLLRSLPEPRVPGDFSANVMRRIRAGEATPTLFDRIASFLDDVFSPRVLVPASAALLSAGFVLWGQQVGLLGPGGSGRGLVPVFDQGPTPETQVEPRVAGVPGAAAAGRSDTQLVSAGVGSVAERPGSFASMGTHDASALGPVVQITISFDGVPAPFRPESVRVTPVPFSPDWRGEWRGDSLMPSIAVATQPTTSLADSTSRDATLRRSAAPPSTGSYGIGGDAQRSEPRSRDEWLASLEANPAQFARQLSQLTLAEQELWVDRLARHAAEQGSLDRVVDRLRTAGDDAARVLAEDFAAVGRSAEQ